MRDQDDDNPKSGDVIAQAQSRVSTPANLLFIISLMLFGWIAFGVYISFFGPDLTLAILEWGADQVPKGSPQHKQMLNDLEKAKVRDRTFEYVQAGVITVVNLIGTVVMLLASQRMKALQSYTFCIIGSVFAIIPCSGCCVLSFPFGLWALIVLLNSDVKAGFAKMAKSGPRIKDVDDDDRWSSRDRDDNTR